MELDAEMDVEMDVAAIPLQNKTPTWAGRGWGRFVGCDGP